MHYQYINAFYLFIFSIPSGFIYLFLFVLLVVSYFSDKFLTYCSVNNSSEINALLSTIEIKTLY